MHYRLAVELDPNYKEGRHNLGLTLAESSDVAGGDAGIPRGAQNRSQL